MAVDPSIYGILNPQGLQQGLAGIGEAYASGRENKARLASLAQQKELQDMQMAEMKQKQALYPQQLAEAQRKRETEYMQNVSREIFAAPEQAEIILEKHAQLAPKFGVNPENITWFASEVMKKPDVNSLKEFAAYHANPAEFEKGWIKSQLEKDKVDEGSPVDIMQGGKPIKIMSKSGRIIGESIPPKSLVNISTAEPAPKAPPGTRVWKEGGEWKTEIMKGTPQWQQLKSKEATDRALVQNIVPTFEKNKEDIDKLLNSKGFESIFGLVGGVTPNLTKDARQADQLRAQIVGATETTGMQVQRASAGSAGSMTVQEWPKMQTYLNIIKNSSDPADVKDALQNIKIIYDRMRDVAKETYMNEWATGQFGDPNVLKRLEEKQKPSQAASPQDSEAVAWAKANQNDPRAAQILRINGVR